MVMTPLGPAKWSFTERNGQPSLSPSIGSWQLPCQSHYWIVGGKVRWASKWTPEQIEEGRTAEEERLQAYFKSRKTKKLGLLGKLWQRLRDSLGRVLRMSSPRN